MKTIRSHIENVIPLKNIREYLATERTELALENTMLAWIRTTLTFMAVGLLISKGIEALSDASVITGKELIKHANITGIFLSITSTIMLTVTTFYFIARRRQLARIRNSFLYKMLPTLLTALCAIIVGIGITYLLIVS